MLHLKKRGAMYHCEEGNNSLGIFIPRHSLKIRVLDKETKKAAEDKLLDLEKATEWPWPPVAKEEPVEAAPLTLLDAYTEWINHYPENSGTREAYSSVQRILLAPLAARGVTLVKEVLPIHLKELQNSWVNEPSKRRKGRRSLNSVQSWRKYTSCLFNHCVNFHEKDCPRNPWKPVKAIKEMPLTVEEIMAGKDPDEGVATMPLDRKGHATWEKIRASVPAFVRAQLPGQKTFRRVKNPLFQHPKTFLVMLWLMYETGLRRSDTLIFRPDKIVNTRHGGMYTTVQVKTRDKVTCFLPQPLVDALRALPLLSWRGAPSAPGAGMFPFFDGSRVKHNHYLKRYLDAPLRELGILLHIEGSLRPHRFRDSFAVNMFNLGMSAEDVRRMLGHRSLATTLKYYAPYVLGMQEAVENRQAAAKQAQLYGEAEAQAKAQERAASVN